MNGDSEIIEVVCVPCSRPAVTTATRDKCHRCQCEIWVAPSSYEFIEKTPNTQLTCDQCVLPILDDLPKGKDVQVYKPTEAQLKEIRKFFTEQN